MVDATSAGEGLAQSLENIREDLRPAYFDQLVTAAGQVSSGQQAAVIFDLLNAAGYYGIDPPPASLSLPADHRLHLDTGTEWYWLSCNLAVDGSDGQDRIGVLAVMNRNRVIANAVQQSLGWTDEQCQVVDSAATVTLATRETGMIIRRRPNVQWAALGDAVEFLYDPSATPPFVYRCGADVFTGGSDQILPLTVQIDDGDNLTLDLVMTSDLPGADAWFRQGINGVTPPPKPGIYYSWPQLSVTGTVTANGQTYSVTGTGWIDHQLMMKSVPPPATPPPPSGWLPVQAFDGWSWCQFNLENGDAFTVAAFQNGSLQTHVFVPYGFYLRRLPSGWDPIPLMGSMDIDRFIPVLEEFIQPTAWTYQAATSPLAPSAGPVDIELTAAPWYPDGSFYTGNLAVPGETPVSVALVDRAAANTATGAGVALTGAGYCESVGYEPPAKYQARALAFLASG